MLKVKVPARKVNRVKTKLKFQLMLVMQIHFLLTLMIKEIK